MQHPTLQLLNNTPFSYRRSKFTWIIDVGRKGQSRYHLVSTNLCNILELVLLVAVLYLQN